MSKIKRLIPMMLLPSVFVNTYANILAMKESVEYTAPKAACTSLLKTMCNFKNYDNFINLIGELVEYILKKSNQELAYDLKDGKQLKLGDVLKKIKEKNVQLNQIEKFKHILDEDERSVIYKSLHNALYEQEEEEKEEMYKKFASYFQNEYVFSALKTMFSNFVFSVPMCIVMILNDLLGCPCW